jgi:peptidyl-prolyl cis-trans isomerase B (cyclophilin B)
MSSYPPQQPPSYGQQPQPPPYQPQGPYGPGPYGAPAYAQSKTNGLAVAAIICGFLFPLLGVIFGIISLNQIGKSNGMQKGRGLALTGLIVGGILLIYSVFAIINAVNSVSESLIF